MVTILFLKRRAGPSRKAMQCDVGHRPNRLTHWSSAAWKPEGTGGFAPIPARPTLSVVPLRTSPGHLILAQIHRVIMVPFQLILL